MHLAIKDICTSGKGDNWSEWSHVENLDDKDERTVHWTEKTPYEHQTT